MKGELKSNQKLKNYTIKTNKIFKGLILFIATMVILSTPFNLLNMNEKLGYLLHEKEFKKVLIKIDSLKIPHQTSQNRYGGKKGSIIYNLYYSDGKFLTLKDASKSVFKSEKEIKITKHALEFMRTHNDSIWIWNHPKFKPKYAKYEDTSLDTTGFVIQIVINLILLIIGFYAIRWQILKWKSKRNIR